jgi:hypothetical protein
MGTAAMVTGVTIRNPTPRPRMGQKMRMIPPGTDLKFIPATG